MNLLLRRKSVPSERFQNALHAVPQQVPPVWFMRQAGRYHRHYQGLRKKHSFVELCRNAELAAEVARGPVEDFDFDVAILFSDLLFPLEALGLSLTYEDSGPHLDPPLDHSNIGQLKSVEDALPSLLFQGEAVARTREVIAPDKSVIGFVGGPWTLFVYAMEGRHQGNLIRSKISADLYREFADRMVPLLTENIRLQLDAGAEVVMIFDTAAGELSPERFRQQTAPDLVRLSKAFPGRTGYYIRGGQPAHLRGSDLEDSGFAGFGVDWRWDLREAFSMVNGRGFVQGNFDQALLFLPPREFEKELQRFLDPLRALSPEQRRGWVCGLGHGVLPGTPEENVRSFVRAVRETFA
jgi:uroporphyrinogen decarboxylase